MIGTRIKKFHVYGYCTECGAEHRIISYWSPELEISLEEHNAKDLEAWQGFIAKHKLCKPQPSGLQLVLTASVKP